MKGPAGWTVVDTGFHDALAEDAWPRAFADLGIRPQDVSQILVTHYHPDHIGAAGWLQQLTGARVYLPETELDQVQRFWGGGIGSIADRLVELFASEGMDPETAESIGKHHLHQFGQVRPLPEFQTVAAGSRLQLGEGSYEVLWTPGHSDGLAVFWDEQTGILLANDMILAKITPNVSIWPGSRPNPLADYLASLERVAGLGVKLALPGHRSLIEDVPGRAREIAAHHDERLVKVAAAAGSGGATAWEVCQRIFPIEALTVHQVRFAMAEALAHLVYLVDQGRMVRDGMRYRVV